MKKFISKKFIVITAVALLLFVTVGSTLAYIFTKTEPVENTFNPSKVACAVVENNNPDENRADIVPNDSIKTNVQIKNTGDTDAYIRVAVVVNWASKDGTKVWATKPVEGTDYTAWTPGTGWIQIGDYYYYTQPVAPTKTTGTLIENIEVLDTANIPDGYFLSVEIVASALQAKPASVVTSQWGVTVANDGTISK